MLQDLKVQTSKRLKIYWTRNEVGWDLWDSKYTPYCLCTFVRQQFFGYKYTVNLAISTCVSSGARITPPQGISFESRLVFALGTHVSSQAWDGTLICQYLLQTIDSLVKSTFWNYRLIFHQMYGKRIQKEKKFVKNTYFINVEVLLQNTHELGE